MSGVPRRVFPSQLTLIAYPRVWPESRALDLPQYAPRRPHCVHTPPSPVTLRHPTLPACRPATHIHYLPASSIPSPSYRAIPRAQSATPRPAIPNIDYRLSPTSAPQALLRLSVSYRPRSRLVDFLTSGTTAQRILNHPKTSIPTSSTHSFSLPFLSTVLPACVSPGPSPFRPHSD